MAHFELVEKMAPNAVIKVIGVGGGGGNAVAHMVSSSAPAIAFCFIVKALPQGSGVSWVSIVPLACGRVTGSVMRRVLRWLAPVATFVLLVVLWDAATRIFGWDGTSASFGSAPRPSGISTVTMLLPSAVHSNDVTSVARTGVFVSARDFPVAALAM